MRALLPQRVYTAEDLFSWLLDTQVRNERAKQAHREQRLQRQRELDTVTWAA